MELHLNTPVERYKINGLRIYVKREDYCTPYPGPPFSKVRGLYAHMKMLKRKGCQTVGYTESSISMAGWGVAWVARELRMKAVIFNPIYKHDTPDLLRIHREKWKELGAEIIPIPAGRTKVNYYISKNLFFNRYPDDSIMLPIGLRLPETVDETATEWYRTSRDPHFHKPRTIVVCVGSGTICAGLLKAVIDEPIFLIGVMAYGRSPMLKRREIIAKAGFIAGDGLHSRPIRKFDLHNLEWEYTEKSRIECPFPCHPYYDLKAWEWLTKNVDRLQGPVLFWNIGSEAK